MKLFRSRIIMIDSEELVSKIVETAHKFKKVNKCLYVDWIAAELKIPKLTLTDFLLTQSHIFSLRIGDKSEKLILKVNETNIPFIFEKEYEIENGNYTIIPLMYNPKMPGNLICLIKKNPKLTKGNFDTGYSYNVCEVLSENFILSINEEEGEKNGKT